MRILLLTPPMVQLNTPYPATAYLTGFLRQHQARLGLEVIQDDPALELFLRIFSSAGLTDMLEELRERAADLRAEDAAALDDMPESIGQFLRHGERYVATIDAVIAFLQGRDPSLALRIATRQLLPEGPRFASLDAALGRDGEDPLGWAFGALGVMDRAKHLASLYLDDLADMVREGIDPNFELARYGERLAAAAASFEPLREALEGAPSYVDVTLDALARELLDRHRPDLIGLTAPFPGNFYGALRLARAMKARQATLKIVLGGGYVNTELRDLSEPRLFDYVDYVTIDDGERPLLALLEHLAAPHNGAEAPPPLFRTFVRDGDRVVLRSDPALRDVPARDTGAPSYAGLPLDRYLSLFEMLNPMHRLWSDGRWNKLTVAHGCYWKKCTFCDVSLDYISRYELNPADVLVDRMEALIAETGQRGFHFVDEAAPPSGLRALAERLLARGVTATWWGNIRFERAFTPELIGLLAASGCVAVSGGLEVASDRLLGLINKGVTVAQVARVTRAFADAGVLVHAYLMYGFPSETTQETVDSLELVRQLFAEGCVQSAYWHRFAATVHSPVGQQPELFGIRLRPAPPDAFARNDVAFEDPTRCDHDALGVGLRRALYNFMHGVGLDEDVRVWFTPTGGRSRRGGPRVPAASVPSDLIRRALHETGERA
ncbi:MAG: radical SAM protein [Kofleriaceae bacterium]